MEFAARRSPAAGGEGRLRGTPGGDTGARRGDAGGWARVKRGFIFPNTRDEWRSVGDRKLDLGSFAHRADYRHARDRSGMSLSRLNHWLPWIQAHPEVVQGTTELHHQIADALLPQADAVFHNAAALDTAVDVLNP